MNTEKIIQEWRLFYFEYKSFFTPVGIIAACVLLFLFVVIPQVQQFLSSQSQLASDQEKLHVLQQNFQQITGFNNQQLDNDYATVLKALPAEKDGISFLNAISQAASSANISLKDYNFEVGKIAPFTGEPPVTILLSVDGNLDNIRQFIHEIQTSLPLGAVSSIDSSSSMSASLNVQFFAKTSFKPNIDPNQAIQLLTKQDTHFIDTLASWQNNSNPTQ